jgi:hypothetical protein
MITGAFYKNGFSSCLVACHRVLTGGLLVLRVLRASASGHKSTSSYFAHPSPGFWDPLFITASFVRQGILPSRLFILVQIYCAKVSPIH